MDPERVGPYSVLRLLGRGGMGSVYLALSPDSRAVAVKVIHPHIADEAGLQRLAREAAAMQRVRDLHVAELVDVDLTAETPYLVTRYVPGRTLSDIVEDQGPLAGEPLDRLAGGLGRALKAIHAAGVVHRDLTPRNVLLTDGEPVVIDFGIVRVLDATRLTQGAPLGTYGYVAPEILHGQRGGPATDLFAWGATIAYAATGRHCFAGRTEPEILRRVLFDDPDLTGVPEPLLSRVRQALSKEPADRPTAIDLLDPPGVTLQPPHAGLPSPDGETMSIAAPTVVESPAPRRPKFGQDVPSHAMTARPAEAMPQAATSGEAAPGEPAGSAAGTPAERADADADADADETVTDWDGESGDVPTVRDGVAVAPPAGNDPGAASETVVIGAAELNETDMSSETVVVLGPNGPNGPDRLAGGTVVMGPDELGALGWPGAAGTQAAGPPGGPAGPGGGRAAGAGAAGPAVGGGPGPRAAGPAVGGGPGPGTAGPAVAGGPGSGAAGSAVGTGPGPGVTEPVRVGPAVVLGAVTLVPLLLALTGLFTMVGAVALAVAGDAVVVGFLLAVYRARPDVKTAREAAGRRRELAGRAGAAEEELARLAAEHAGLPDRHVAELKALDERAERLKAEQTTETARIAQTAEERAASLDKRQREFPGEQAALAEELARVQQEHLRATLPRLEPGKVSGLAAYAVQMLAAAGITTAADFTGVEITPQQFGPRLISFRLPSGGRVQVEGIGESLAKRLQGWRDQQYWKAKRSQPAKLTRERAEEVRRRRAETLRALEEERRQVEPWAKAETAKLKERIAAGHAEVVAARRRSVVDLERTREDLERRIVIARSTRDQAHAALARLYAEQPPDKTGDEPDSLAGFVRFVLQGR